MRGGRNFRFRVVVTKCVETLRRAHLGHVFRGQGRQAYETVLKDLHSNVCLTVFFFSSVCSRSRSARKWFPTGTVLCTVPGTG